MLAASARLRIARVSGPLVTTGAIVGVLSPAIVSADDAGASLVFVVVGVYLTVVSPAWLMISLMTGTAWATLTFWLLLLPAIYAAANAADGLGGQSLSVSVLLLTPTALAVLIVMLERFARTTRPGSIHTHS